MRRGKAWATIQFCFRSIFGAIFGIDLPSVIGLGHSCACKHQAMAAAIEVEATPIEVKKGEVVPADKDKEPKVASAGVRGA